MDLAGLVADFWVLADDVDSQDPVVSADTLERFFAEAEDEACVRARLIHESEDPADRDDPICSIPVEAGTSVYPIAFYELTHLSFMLDGATTRTAVNLVTPEYLDGPSLEQWLVPGSDPLDRDDWRDMTGTPTLAIQTDTGLRLVPKPDADGTLLLEGYRLPLGEVGRDPEINPVHHRHLIQWALFRVFSIPGMDQTDKDKAKIALTEFERYFGPRPDADLRRSTRHDPPKHVEAFFP